ncbi:LPS export ABC transporter permease LptG [Thiomicrorhabdus indica]|uniref:LPS export ABC transporter permease LptG n=1 Tax=Thiomicrorhabdus indica TaxID=2267253 RepID=UPI001F103617|nr:LPS export ABC transporter permease LptG [Thiomicrorhabdus indica]
MNRVERYLSSVLVVHFLLVLLVLLALIGFTEFMNQLDDLTDDYAVELAAIYVLLKLPNYIVQLFPVALLIGTLMGMGNLANHSELTVLRVTGWSIRRIFLAVIKVALLLWVFVTIMGETIGVNAETYANKLRAESLNKQFSLGQSNGFWVKNNQRFIEIGQAISNQDLRDVVIYHLQKGELTKQASYPQVRFESGQWIGRNGVKKTLDWMVKPEVPELKWIDYQYENLNSVQLSLPFLPADLEKLTVKSTSLNLIQLQEQIDFLQVNGGDPSTLKMAYWNKLASPLVVLAMIAIVFPLIFGSQRQVSMGQRIFIGVLIGLLFHLGNQLIGNLSAVYQLPAVMAAFIPAGILLIVALLWLRLQR